MGWHIDDIIYHPEQIEVVFTLENTSDCCTMWRPHDQLLPSSQQLSKNDDHHDSRQEHPKYQNTTYNRHRPLPTRHDKQGGRSGAQGISVDSGEAYYIENGVCS